MSQSNGGAGAGHLSPEQIVSYVDQTICEEARLRLEAHLAECQACLNEVLEVRRLVRKQVELGPESHHLE